MESRLHSESIEPHISYCIIPNTPRGGCDSICTVRALMICDIGYPPPKIGGSVIILRVFQRPFALGRKQMAKNVIVPFVLIHHTVLKPSKDLREVKGLEDICC
jgi:hypothetical protein